LWDRNCPISAACEPYINPAAFMRPAKGSLGNAPRTLDIRAPFQEYFDLSFQKNFGFPFGNDSKRRLQFRVDLINAFNHPNFRLNNLSGSAGFTNNVPAEVNFTQAELNAYLAANPGSTVTLAQVNNLIAANRLPSGALPLDFFRVPLPEGFSSRNLNSFNITTVEGFKLYRLRQAYNPDFGTLREVQQPRYVQFGIKIYF